MDLIGLPLTRAISAAAPAVEPKSIDPALQEFQRLVHLVDCTQRIADIVLGEFLFEQAFLFQRSLTGLYVAPVDPDFRDSAASADDSPSPKATAAPIIAERNTPITYSSPLRLPSIRSTGTGDGRETYNFSFLWNCRNIFPRPRGRVVRCANVEKAEGRERPIDGSTERKRRSAGRPRALCGSCSKSEARLRDVTKLIRKADPIEEK